MAWWGRPPQFTALGTRCGLRQGPVPHVDQRQIPDEIGVIHHHPLHLCGQQFLEPFDQGLLGGVDRVNGDELLAISGVQAGVIDNGEGDHDQCAESRREPPWIRLQTTDQAERQAGEEVRHFLLGDF